LYPPEASILENKETAMTATLTILHPGVESPPPDSVASTAGANAGGLAPRIDFAKAGNTLRLALLDNTKVNADRLLEAVGKRLKAHGFGEVRMWRKRHAGESGADAIADLLKWKPNLVLTGLGD